MWIAVKRVYLLLGCFWYDREKTKQANQSISMDLDLFDSFNDQADKDDLLPSIALLTKKRQSDEDGPPSKVRKSSFPLSFLSIL